MEDCTWEPKNNIWDSCLVESYEVGKVYDKLNGLDADEQCSTTKRVLRALRVGKRKLGKLIHEGLSPHKKRSPITRRMCPFCHKKCNVGGPFSTHMMGHRSEDNFDLIKEGSSVIREEWYD